MNKRTIVAGKVAGNMDKRTAQNMDKRTKVAGNMSQKSPLAYCIYFKQWESFPKGSRRDILISQL